MFFFVGDLGDDDGAGGNDDHVLIFLCQYVFYQYIMCYWVVVLDMFYIFIPIWGNDPILLIFFKRVGSTTN